MVLALEYLGTCLLVTPSGPSMSIVSREVGVSSINLVPPFLFISPTMLFSSDLNLLLAASLALVFIKNLLKDFYIFEK